MSRLSPGEFPRFDIQYFAGEKTEDPTEKRLTDARNRGQIAKSADLNAALVLTGIIIYLYLYGGHFYAKLFGFARLCFAEKILNGSDISSLISIIRVVALKYISVIYPIFLIAFIVAIISNYYQVGILITTHPLIPDFNKLNPINGFQNMFSKNSINNLLKSVAKITVIAMIPIFVLWREITNFLVMNRKEVGFSAIYLKGVIFEIVTKVLVMLLVLAIADYAFQKWQHWEKLKMSKDEVKDEHKSREGDPKVKQRIRQKGRELAQGRMFQDLPKADVVITNPTHLALAIHYDQEVPGSAPKLIAKGSGYMAARIREVAEAHNIPLVENKPLARALYAQSEIGDEIPEELYQAVAEILGAIYSSRKAA